METNLKRTVVFLLTIIGSFINTASGCKKASDQELALITQEYTEQKSRNAVIKRDFLFNAYKKVACRKDAEITKIILKDLWEQTQEPGLGYTYANTLTNEEEKIDTLKTVVSKSEHGFSLYALGDFFEKNNNFDNALHYYKRAMLVGRNTSTRRLFKNERLYSALNKNEKLFVILEMFRKTYPNSYARKEIEVELDRRLKSLIDPNSEDLIRYYVENLRKDF